MVFVSFSPPPPTNSNSLIVNSKYEQMWRWLMKKLWYKQKKDGVKCMPVSAWEMVGQMYSPSASESWWQVLLVHPKEIWEIKSTLKKTCAHAVSLLGIAGTVFCLNNLILSPTTKISAKPNQNAIALYPLFKKLISFILRFGIEIWDHPIK